MCTLVCCVYTGVLCVYWYVVCTLVCCVYTGVSMFVNFD